MANSMELSEKIHALRAETGLNRKQFAEHFQIPLRTVEEWEAGRRKERILSGTLWGIGIIF